MTDATIHPLHRPTAHDDAAYELERAELLGNSAREAGTYWGQGIAHLIYKYSCVPGWTEQRLSDKEKALGNKGASRPYIHKKIIFGEFLTIVPNWNNGENPSWLKDVSEGRFRKHWEMTKDMPTEERFNAVAEMLQAPPEPKIDGAALLKKFGDGKWHRIETIADFLDASVERTLEFIRKRHWAGGAHRAKAEVRKSGKSFQVQIFVNEQMVSIIELTEKLSPIIEYLKTEGSKGMATTNIGAAREAASMLRNLLKEWAE